MKYYISIGNESAQLNRDYRHDFIELETEESVDVIDAMYFAIRYNKCIYVTMNDEEDSNGSDVEA